MTQNPKVGDITADGSIYVGDSPNTHKPMFVTSVDAPSSIDLGKDFNAAVRYAQKLKAHGHKDWRLPTAEELNVIFENCEKGALKETFNRNGSLSANYYWSSTVVSNSYDTKVCTQRFWDGKQSRSYPEGN